MGMFPDPDDRMAIVPPVKTIAMRATRRCYRLWTEPLREIDEWISP
jgi:hypothetical protein